jgi:hypothetical protein
MTEKERKSASTLLAQMSAGDLDPTERSEYIALQIGDGPNKNAVVLHFDRVSFFVQSEYLIERAKTEGFKPEPAERKSPQCDYKVRFWGLSLSDIEAHEALFRDIVIESIRIVRSRRPTKSRRLR